jgi:polyhydroxyalkanoate synthase
VNVRQEGFARALFHRLTEKQAAIVAQQQRAVRKAFSFPSVIDAALRTRVGTTPHDVVFSRGTLRLLRYRRETPAAYAEPMLFCYALVNRPYILDLQPDKSVVRQYLQRGFDVYLIDWGSPSLADRYLKIEDYVSRFLEDVVRFILREHRREQLHLLGYCMGGTLAALFTALTPRRIRTLTLLAAPIDFSGRESLLQVWTDRNYFDVDAFVDAYGNCPATFLQFMFLNMKPIQNFIEKYLAFYEHMDDPRFLANYFAMERWANDNIPIAGETFREYVKKFYQENELVRGTFSLGGQHVDLQRISCPLLLLTATHDHLVPPASTLGIRAHVASRDVQEMSIDAGHVGLVVSGKAHKSFWPQATGWAGERAGARTTPPGLSGPAPTALVQAERV